MPREGRFLRAGFGYGNNVARAPAEGMAMIYKLLEEAEGRWRRLNGYRLIPLVRAGARFLNGGLVERNEEKDAA